MKPKYIVRIYYWDKNSAGRVVDVSTHLNPFAPITGAIVLADEFRKRLSSSDRKEYKIHKAEIVGEYNDRLEVEPRSQDCVVILRDYLQPKDMPVKVRKSRAKKQKEAKQ